MTAYKKEGIPSMQETVPEPEDEEEEEEEVEDDEDD